ncbi:MAG: FtsX-like permease family protein [Bacillota bacterium]|nr:FtsX-like permease family protein [Bacillota bacterium]
MVKIGDAEFTAAGFLRDSQMNAMMASSKRFLVSEEDYELLKDSVSEEYLIEFLLKEGTDTNEFSLSYTEAGLPANGPAITKPLIKMMNALSYGIMIMVILLASAVLLLISMLCIRFTLMTQLECDRKEIGMMKAVGLPKKEIRSLYFTKYFTLSVLGAALGLGLAFVLRGILSYQMQELYGPGGNVWTGFTGIDIKILYLRRFLPIMITGIAGGILAGNIIGEQLAGVFLKTLGSEGFRFLIDYKAVFGWIPGTAVITVFFAILIGLAEVRNIKAYDCCTEKE